MKKISLFALSTVLLLSLTGCERIGKHAAKEYIEGLHQELAEKNERIAQLEAQLMSDEEIEAAEIKQRRSNLRSLFTRDKAQ